MATKGQRAYEMRAKHHTWDEIAYEIGTASSLSALVGARKYARKNGLAWPIDVPSISALQEPEKHAVAKWAYHEAKKRPLRRRWHTMTDAPENTLNATHTKLAYLAEQYAKDNDLAWPAPVEVASLGEQAYALAATGVLWPEVAEEVGFDHVSNAIESARRWAEKHDLAWPLFRMRKAA